MSDEHKCLCADKQEEELYPKLAEIVEKNRGKAENLIMVLHKAQNLFGYLPKKVQQIVAEGLGLSLSQVYGVVTFYSFFSTFPKGRNTVKVCLGTACYVQGRSKGALQGRGRARGEGGQHHGGQEIFSRCGPLHRGLRSRPCHPCER